MSKELYPGFRKEYELALETGKRRFGSPCKHEVVKNGRCANCQRKVTTSKTASK